MWLTESLVHQTWVSEQCFTSPPTQYRLYGRRFLQVLTVSKHSRKKNATKLKKVKTGTEWQTKPVRSISTGHSHWLFCNSKRITLKQKIIIKHISRLLRRWNNVSRIKNIGTITTITTMYYCYSTATTFHNNNKLVLVQKRQRYLNPRHFLVV